MGLADLTGVDGYAPDERLRISREQFLRHDLTTPLRLERTFDLVINLEVAEHLPPDAARTLVDSLTGLGPVVLFSAAIPLQGGTHHVNEQWQEYWAALFLEHGFVAVDAVRPRIWANPSVAYYYAQNCLLFVRPDELERKPSLAEERRLTRDAQLSLVHPSVIQRLVDTGGTSLFPLRDVLRSMPKWIARSVARRVGARRSGH